MYKVLYSFIRSLKVQLCACPSPMVRLPCTDAQPLGEVSMSSNTLRKYASDVSDFEWEFIEPFTRQKPGRGRRRTVDLRAVVTAIFYLNKTGCQWEMLPHEFPDYRHVNYSYNQWRKDGTWDTIQTTVGACARIAEGRDPEPSMAIIDSQSVKTDQYGEDQDYAGHKQVKGNTLVL